MKRIYFIIIISAAILAIVVGLQFFDKSGENQNTQTPTIPGTVDSILDELKSQTNSEGSITISVTPHRSASAGVWEFEITLDTHSVELDDDVNKATVLIADNKNYYPIVWDGDPPGGHHRNGILQFAPISPEPESIALKIRNIGGVEERNFIWQIK